ncbi:MAG TPA: hypothetical protein VM510_17155, partial [Caulifigura sp.]|nr:hypothetical protein [Caulifigura sp.]
MAARGRKPGPPPAPPAKPVDEPVVRVRQPRSPEQLAALALAFSVCTGFVFAIHPASLTFWDPGRSSYWRTLYVPGERPKEYDKIAR